MWQSCDIGLDSLYCGKWRKISKSHHDLDLDQTMPNVKIVQAIYIYYNMFKFLSGFNHYFLSYHETEDRQTDTQLATQTQTDMSTL